MIIEGTAVVIPQDNVDTDVLYPGRFLNIDDPDKMRAYLFEGLDPSLRERLGSQPILMVGENFGSGSSREHVVHAMNASGIRAVVGKSFARIFHRNCINLGLPVVLCPAAVAATREGDDVLIEGDAGTVSVAGTTFPAAPIPEFIEEMVRIGGLVPWAQQRLGVGHDAAATGDVTP